MKRQHRFHPEYGNAVQWKRFVEAVGKSAAIRATGAFIDGRLAAYVITCHEDGWVHHLEQMSRIEDLGKFPNHALTFRVIQDAMQDPNVLAVCNGPAALVGNKGLDTYKLQLGYEKLPQSVAYQFHPAVAPVLTNSITLRLLRSGGQRWERVSAVLHAAKMFRTEAQHYGI